MDKKFHAESPEEILDFFGTDPEKGLSPSEVNEKRAKYGKNLLPRRKSISPLKIFLEQFKSIIIILLVIAVIISYLMNDRAESVAIAVVILLNSVIGFTMEYRAEKSVEALKSLLTEKSKVLREGLVQEIDSSELVPGDILVLEEGDRIGADGRIIREEELHTDESMLTGESLPAEKSNSAAAAESSVADRNSMVYMGTAVVKGTARVIVTGTGSETEMGQISTLLAEEKDEKTPLEKKIDRMGHTLVFITAGIAVFVFGAGCLVGIEILEMAKTGIALAIAAVPEGLPAVFTITLAIGMGKMSREKALVKSLPAVETLGSTTYICTDKTGTLTQNKMSLRRILLPDAVIEVSGDGYVPEGNFVFTDGSEGGNAETLEKFLRCGKLCSNASVYEEKGEWVSAGDPTEAALVTAYLKRFSGEEPEEGERLEEMPFSSDYRYMAVVQEKNSVRTIYLKGAPEVVLEKCANPEVSEWLEKNEKLAASGFRVIALGMKAGGKSFADDLEEGNFEFLGLAAIADPPRTEVRESIALAAKAGIRTVMITGDQKKTAVAIAKEIGLAEDGNPVMTDAEVSAMTAEELSEKICGGMVFSRISPADKLKIVEALKIRDEIVAMTGDGVNDAPALKRADIGVAMGKRGTEVARHASEMILLDDDFSTIVKAVKYGRVVFDNTEKFIHYLFSCNLSEIIYITFGILLRLPLPLVALQILWLNLVTDVFPALVMAWEAPEEEIMERPPRKPGMGIMNSGLLGKIGFQGMLLAVASMSVFYFSVSAGFSVTEARTTGFMTLALVQLFHVFNVRRKNGLGFDRSALKNPYLGGAVLLTVLLQLAAVYFVPLAGILSLVPMTPVMWLISSAGVIIPILIIQMINGIFSAGRVFAGSFDR